MDKIEQLEQEMYDNNIKFSLEDFSLNSFSAAIIRQAGQCGIFIDKNLNNNDKIHYIEHELAHYHTSSFYNFKSTSTRVTKQEQKATDFVCKNYLPLEKIKELYCKGFEVYEISELLNISELSIKDAIKYLYRKEMIPLGCIQI